MNDLINREEAITRIEKAMYSDGFRSGTGLIHKTTVYEILRGLPTVHQEEIRINLNESVKVKLTDFAKEIYYHKYDDVNKRYGKEVCKPSFPEKDENGYSTFQLWNFMNLYGEYISIGSQEIIIPLEIVYAVERS